MARSKDHWLALWSSVGLSLGPKRYAVHVGLELPREPGRMVDLYLDPDKAESLGRSLLKYAAKVRELNEPQEKAERVNKALDKLAGKKTGPYSDFPQS